MVHDVDDSIIHCHSSIIHISIDKTHFTISFNSIHISFSQKLGRTSTGRARLTVTCRTCVRVHGSII